MAQQCGFLGQESALWRNKADSWVRKVLCSVTKQIPEIQRLFCVTRVREASEKETSPEQWMPYPCPEDALSIGDFGSVACFYTDVSKIDVDPPHKSEPLHRIAIPKVLSTGENVRELEIGAKRVVEVVSGGKVQVVQVAHLDIVAVEEGAAPGNRMGKSPEQGT